MRCRLGLPAITFDFAIGDVLAGILIIYYGVTLISRSSDRIFHAIAAPTAGIPVILLGYPFEGIPNPAGSNLQIPVRNGRKVVTVQIFKKLVENSKLNPNPPPILLSTRSTRLTHRPMVLSQIQPHLQMTRTTSLRRVSNAKLPIHHHCVPKETVLVGTKASNEKPNASGLTPDQTRALPERSVDPDGPEARIVRSLRELYSCKARDVRL